MFIGKTWPKLFLWPDRDSIFQYRTLKTVSKIYIQYIYIRKKNFFQQKSDLLVTLRNNFSVTCGYMFRGHKTIVIQNPTVYQDQPGFDIKILIFMFGVYNKARLHLGKSAPRAFVVPEMSFNLLQNSGPQLTCGLSQVECNVKFQRLHLGQFGVTFQQFMSIGPKAHQEFRTRFFIVTLF